MRRELCVHISYYTRTTCYAVLRFYGTTQAQESRIRCKKNRRSPSCALSNWRRTPGKPVQHLRRAHRAECHYGSWRCFSVSPRRPTTRKLYETRNQHRDGGNRPNRERPGGCSIHALFGCLPEVWQRGHSPPPSSLERRVVAQHRGEPQELRNPVGQLCRILRESHQGVHYSPLPMLPVEMGI